ncbi:hypothetical protein, partial [Nostoc sp. CCY 9925]|uniref:hypothetical protein n=1 Tax=Nostoc sp. CCY 9925 TaxID=3103865 RepID=UPI0039C5AA97
ELHRPAIELHRPAIELHRPAIELHRPAIELRLVKTKPPTGVVTLKDLCVPDFSRYLENPASIPLPCKERGFDFSPFPSREGGWGVRFCVSFST